VWQTELHNPNFASFAKLCGGKGIRVTKIEKLGPALDEALAYAGPALVEIITDADLI
jgi:thiamine pyrophosphate-dependent acetolactate synthase large subunit-like protein